VADQSQPSDRSPTYILDQSAIHLRMGSNHHRSPGELAVVESQEQARSPVELRLALNPHRKRPPLKLRQREKNRDNIPPLTVAAETARSQCGHVSGKSYAQQIDVVEDAAAVAKSEYIARLAALCQ